MWCSGQSLIRPGEKSQNSCVTGRLTVGEIAANFRTSRPAISKHLRLLRTAGLVISSKDGTASVCGLNPKPLKTVNDRLEDYRALWSESLRNLKRYVEEPANQKKEKS